jgi:nicotinamide mononucleotide adenylyltransferase
MAKRNQANTKASLAKETVNVVTPITVNDAFKVFRSYVETAHRGSLGLVASGAVAFLAGHYMREAKNKQDVTAIKEELGKIIVATIGERSRTHLSLMVNMAQKLASHMIELGAGGMIGQMTHFADAAKATDYVIQSLDHIKTKGGKSITSSLETMRVWLGYKGQADSQRTPPTVAQRVTTTIKNAAEKSGIKGVTLARAVAVAVPQDNIADTAIAILSRMPADMLDGFLRNTAAKLLIEKRKEETAVQAKVKAAADKAAKATPKAKATAKATAIAAKHNAGKGAAPKGAAVHSPA